MNQKLESGFWRVEMGAHCLYCKTKKPAEFKPDGPFWVFIQEKKGGFLLCPLCFDELKPKDLVISKGS